MWPFGYKSDLIKNVSAVEKNSHRRKILVRSQQQKCSRSVPIISDDGYNATATVICYPPLFSVLQVVLHTLVSLNLAQAQLFGPQPSRPTFISNDRIVDQVLDELSPTIAQVDPYCHGS